jgi:hypothetical protein
MPVLAIDESKRSRFDCSHDAALACALLSATMALRKGVALRDVADVTS